jgi:hypothetical protein
MQRSALAGKGWRLKKIKEKRVRCILARRGRVKWFWPQASTDVAVGDQVIIWVPAPLPNQNKQLFSSSDNFKRS